MNIKETNTKNTEKNVLLRRVFDDKVLLMIGKEMGDGYCINFNENGYDKDYKYFNKEEVVKKLINMLSDDQMLDIFERYKDKLLPYWQFRGRYYTYDPSTKVLSFTSQWDEIKEEIYNVYKELGEPVYGVLKAFLEIPCSSSYYTYYIAECKYGPLLYKAETLAGKGCKKALDGLCSTGIMTSHKGDVEVSTELVPLIEEVVFELEKSQETSETPSFEPLEQIDLPTDLFDTIIGYDDVKELFNRALTINEPFHILLIGPPASAKTMFLLELERLPRSIYALGSGTSKAGLADFLFNNQPRYLLIDELDKMHREDYAVLLSLCETGDVVEVKYRKTRRVKLVTWVFAAANYETQIPKEVLSRFQILRFPRYNREQFLETAIGVLIRRMKVEQSLAQYISEKTYNILGTGDIRQVIRIAKLSNSKEDVDKWVNVVRSYSGEE